MTERVDDPADAPAMLVGYPSRRGGTSVHRLVENSFRVTDHEQHPAGCPADGQRAEAVPVRPCRCHPERGILDGELGNDVVSFTNPVKDSRAERGLIEGDSRTGSIQPQLRLYSSHGGHDNGGRTVASDEDDDWLAVGRAGYGSGPFTATRVLVQTGELPDPMAPTPQALEEPGIGATALIAAEKLEPKDGPK